LLPIAGLVDYDRFEHDSLLGVVQFSKLADNNLASRKQ
jgi:hypothetical protein